MVTAHYFKNKLNPIHHGLLKNKSRITNFVPYLDFISSLASSQHELFSIHFALGSCLTLLHILFHSINFLCMDSQMVMEADFTFTFLFSILLPAL